MTTEDANIALYRRWLDKVWGEGDLAVADEVLAADFVDHDCPPGVPNSRVGHDMTLDLVRTAFPDARFTSDVVLAAGDLVSGRWTMVGTHTGPFHMLGLAPTGRSVRMCGQEIFRVRDGKLAEVWHQEGVLGLLAQLGAMPGVPPH